jgi:hypothetical protein
MKKISVKNKIESKKYIKIESKGVIDPQAFILLGASTKRADNSKIGFFGSGLKYSIAYLLRNDIPFKVFAEYNEIKFGTVTTPFRDNSFEVISINGEKTSMTSEMGLDWEAWFVVREIYCNALDEGESKISVVSESDCLPIEDKTVFYIECNKEFDDIIKDWNLYFSENRQDILNYDNEGNQIYTGGNDLIVYRKGIRCYYAPNQKCSFNYDMNWISINESRTIKSDWDFKWNLKMYLQKCTDKKIITHLYNTICDTFEKTLDFASTSHLFSEEWLECLAKKTLVPYENAGYWSEIVDEAPLRFFTLPSNLIEGLKAKFTDKVRVVGEINGISTKGELRVCEELTKKQQQLLKDARLFLASAEYPIKYEIKVVDFVKAEVRGQALDNTILLSQKLFEMGRKEIVSVIIEEQEHLITGFGDETRAFQTHFIHKFVTALEEKTNTYL